jgi:high-affinity iron transporter
MTLDLGALLIGLREGLEALLVLGILLGMLRRLGHGDKRRTVWLGAVAGVLAAVAAGLLVEAAFQAWFQDTGAALFEVVVALAAVVILTYMVLWMQRHTTQLLGTVKTQVAKATATGRWGLLGALAFVTVFREGIEVVLFYAARSAELSWTTLLASGAVGLALSAIIAYAIFRLTVEVPLRAFFGITGLLLVLIAAGLLVHVGHAAADLGWIPHGEPLWDTSGLLPDEDHWLGGPLHALIGYEDQPTALQLLLYLTYLVGVGGWYLATLLRPQKRAHRARSAAAGLLFLLLASFAFTGALSGPAHDEHSDLATHGHAPDHAALLADAIAALEGYDGRIGVLVRSHGEPVHYNASTYESFKHFVDGFWRAMGLPPEALQVDQGTYLIDEAHPWSSQVHTDARLVDAWVNGFSGVAIPVTDPSGASPYHEYFGGTYYLAPGQGPGLGEGDLYEIFGLGAYRTWLKMENYSPHAFAAEEAFAYLERHLWNHFGDQVVPAFASHIDPKLSAHRSIEAAAKRLAEADVDVVLDVYMSSVHSDAMNTCMMAPHAEHALHAAGYRGPIVRVDEMAGHQASWARGVADKVQEELALRPAGAVVSIHLVQHGGDPDSNSPCRAGPDPYHANNRQQFDLAAAAIRERVGPITIRHVYGQGAGASGDGVLGPMEALGADARGSVTHTILVPYEFWGNAMDHLVNLRENLGFTPDQSPYYDASYDTRFTHQGIDVHIVDQHHGIPAKAEALLAVIGDALAKEVTA